jgi:hypothetical protein
MSVDLFMVKSVINQERERERESTSRHAWSDHCFQVALIEECNFVASQIEIFL